MSIFLFRTSKELNSNGPNFVRMSMFFKKYSSFLLSNGIGSKTRLTSFKSQFSHLLGLGLKFGPMKYINSYQSANNRQSTRFIFSYQTEDGSGLFHLHATITKKRIVKDSEFHDLPLALKLRKRNLCYFCKNTVNTLRQSKSYPDIQGQIIHYTK